VVDILEHARERKAGGVLPQTTMGDITALSSVLRYAADVWELPDTGLQTVRRAKSQLHREQLIASSKKRTRLPTEDELARLFALFEQQNQRPKNKIDMVLTTHGRDPHRPAHQRADAHRAPARRRREAHLLALQPEELQGQGLPR
jgi:hypothetical protein